MVLLSLLMGVCAELKTAGTEHCGDDPKKTTGGEEDEALRQSFLATLDEEDEGLEALGAEATQRFSSARPRVVKAPRIVKALAALDEEDEGLEALGMEASQRFGSAR